MVAPRRLLDVLLGLLAVVAVALAVLAVSKVNQPRPHAASLGAESSPVAVGVTEDAATTTRETEADETTSRAAEPDPRAWRDAWSGDADLLVVGDGFSHLPSQWLQLWAERVGDDRPVTIRYWGEAEDVAFNDPVVLSDGDGEPLTVWSASRGGSTIHDAAEDYQRFVDASTAPDAVLITMGLDSGEEDVAEGLDELVAQIDDEDAGVPVLLTIGPDGLYDEGVGDALRAWAEDHPDRVSVLDLRGEAPDGASAEQWATSFHVALESL